jgi:hypothetical protein
MLTKNQKPETSNPIPGVIYITIPIIHLKREKVQWLLAELSVVFAFLDHIIPDIAPNISVYQGIKGCIGFTEIIELADLILGDL